MRTAYVRGRVSLTPRSLPRRRTNGGEAVRLSTDHKPGLPSETARIEAAGGVVWRRGGVDRVNGALAVSRAFGDLCMGAGVISAEPGVTCTHLGDDDEFVILQFAQFIFQLVGRDEAIHASETLPASNRQALSAYANSYAWNAGTAAVFFRRARLTNIGDCLSVAIHAAAYVGAGGGAIGDTDPAFIAELHRCVALVYSDLFAASLK